MYDAKILEILEAEPVHSDVGEYVTLKGEAAREEGGSRILVHGTEAETWLVPGDGTFYLDTRITLRDSTDQPQAEILALKMSPTLFQEVDGA